ncbi:MAG: hypothetical protein ACREVZ_13830 [Burkholderiales bacterium]
MLRVPRMQFWTVALFAVLLFAASAGRTFAGDLYIACNTRVSLERSDVRELFLGEKHFAGSIKLDPVDNAAAQADFLARVLQMDHAKYSRVWIKKSFRDGINPPQMLGSDIEVLAYIKRTPGGCGYLTTAPGSAVTFVGKF